MSELKLEADKFYCTRNGSKVKLTQQLGDIWIGAILSDNGRWRGYDWELTGAFNSKAGECGLDIFSEWNDIDDNWRNINLSKVTLEMLPIKARFRNSQGEPWKISKLYGYWSKDLPRRPIPKREYQCGDSLLWSYCQIKDEIK